MMPIHHLSLRTFLGLRYSILSLLVAFAFLGGCATNPATGKRQLAPLMSAQEEARIGAESHPKIVQTYGGVYPDEKVSVYVAGITSRIGRATNQPDAPYRVTVLNSSIVNAFALPGGYVYVTRGLMALVNDEAELAGVIGHEIGHVAARHSAQRQTAAMGAGLLGAVLGAVVGSEAVSQAINLGGQGVLASYSRDQEFEADMLGVRYLAGAGYDPHAAADFLHSMGAQQGLEARARNLKSEAGTNWLSSHPATPDRVAAANTHARNSGASSGQKSRNRDAYLNAINGLLYGDDPAEGVVRGQEFIHPKLGFAFKAPRGFTITNSSAAVLLEGPDKTLAKFDTAKKDSHVDVAQYLTGQWGRNVQLSGLERFNVNGMKAAAAYTRIGEYSGRLVAIEYAPDRVYRFLLGVMPQLAQKHSAALNELVSSFRKISAQEARNVKPLRIRVVTVRNGETALSLGKRMAYSDMQADRFRVLNGLKAGEDPRPGERVKLITY